MLPINAARDGGASGRGCLAASLPGQADAVAHRAAQRGDGGGDGEATEVGFVYFYIFYNVSRLERNINPR